MARNHQLQGIMESGCASSPRISFTGMLGAKLLLVGLLPLQDSQMVSAWLHLSDREMKPLEEDGEEGLLRRRPGH